MLLRDWYQRRFLGLCFKLVLADHLSLDVIPSIPVLLLYHRSEPIIEPLTRVLPASLLPLRLIFSIRFLLSLLHNTSVSFAVPLLVAVRLLLRVVLLLSSFQPLVLVSEALGAEFLEVAGVGLDAGELAVQVGELETQGNDLKVGGTEGLEVTRFLGEGTHTVQVVCALEGLVDGQLIGQAGLQVGARILILDLLDDIAQGVDLKALGELVLGEAST